MCMVNATIARRVLSVQLALWGAFLVGAIASPLQAAGALASKYAAPSSAHVFVNAINCPEDNQAPAVYLGTTAYGKDYVLVNSTSKRNDRGLYSVSLVIPPGHYYIMLRTKHCDARFALTILKGQDRHLLAVLGHLFPMIETNYSLAGHLPLEGLALVLLNSAISKDVVARAVVDGQSYFFENLFPAKYVLRVLLPGTGLQADFPIDLTDKESAGKPLALQKHFAKDITYEELRAQLGTRSSIGTSPLGR
ncbi:MAG TPA: hypothetical protein VN934_05910 [Candidatus Tumulicola sp.]|nr:hypothetical protein [Candidatus Tumulicola sp.]